MRLVRTLILAAVASALSVSAAAAQRVSVASSSGPVDLLRGDGGKWAPLGKVEDLQQRDLIRTGSGGTTRLSFDDGSVVVLSSSSLLRLDEMGKKDGRPRVLLRLLGGQVRATVSKAYGTGEGRFEIETPTAVASVRGTEFIVTYDTVSADSEVICIEGSVEVLGVLGVLGRPVVLEPGMGTTVRKGAFPAAPAPVPADKIGAMRKLEEGAVSYEDSLIATFTGADSEAVLNPRQGVARQAAAEGRRQSLRTRAKVVSKDAEIIDQSIQEYTLTPPGQTPPGIVDVIIQP